MVITTKSSPPLLGRAIARWTALIKDHSATTPVKSLKASDASLFHLTLVVGSDDEALSDRTNESYSLKVGADGVATATSPSVYGALRALASFSQLVEVAPASLVVRGLPWAIETRRATLIAASSSTPRATSYRSTC